MYIPDYICISTLTRCWLLGREMLAIGHKNRNLKSNKYIAKPQSAPTKMLTLMVVKSNNRVMLSNSAVHQQQTSFWKPFPEIYQHFLKIPYFDPVAICSHSASSSSL